MSFNKPINKENMDLYLKELAKEYRKQNGKNIPAEIILIGGASALANYGFRDITYDIDAIISVDSLMKGAINTVGDKYGLPNGWLNTDFKKTDSYSVKLVEKSKHYKTFSNVVNIRTISAEYLVAMKMIAGRRFKHDLSDIVGIIQEQKDKNEPLSYGVIEQAIIELYGTLDKIEEHVINLVKTALDHENCMQMYYDIKNSEKEANEILTDFAGKYPRTLNKNNTHEILDTLKKNKDRYSLKVAEQKELEIEKNGVDNSNQKNYEER